MFIHGLLLLLLLCGESVGAGGGACAGLHVLGSWPPRLREGEGGWVRGVAGPPVCLPGSMGEGCKELSALQNHPPTAVAVAVAAAGRKGGKLTGKEDEQQARIAMITNKHFQDLTPPDNLVQDFPFLPVDILPHPRMSI
eukprot:1143259-Pelagomonas_calceolata.AAC.3